MRILLNPLRCDSWFSIFLHVDPLFAGLYQTHSLVFNHGDGSSRGNACTFAQCRCGFPLFSWWDASPCSGGCWVFSPGKRKLVFYVCLRQKDMHTFFFPGQNISNRRCSNLDYYPEQIIRLNYMKLLTLKNFNLKKTNFMWFNLKYCCKCARWDIFCPCLSPNKSLMVAHSPSPPRRDSFCPGQMAGFTQRLMSLESVYDPGRENPAHVVCDKELGL